MSNEINQQNQQSNSANSTQQATSPATQTAQTAQNAQTAQTTPQMQPAPAAAPKTSGLGIASLVLGIVAIIGSWVPILNNFSAILAFIGLVLGIIGIVTISKSKGAKSGKGVAVAGTVISIVAIVVVLATQSLYGKAIDSASESWDKSTSKATGGATEELLQNDVSVDFGAYTVEDKTYYKTGKLTVTITNKTSEAKSFNVQLEALDSSGNRIEDGYAYASKLQGGQSTTQEIFHAMSDEKVAQFQNATFKVVSVSEY